MQVRAAVDGFALVLVLGAAWLLPCSGDGDAVAAMLEGARRLEDNSGASPVRKVVNLLGEMKAQVEKESAADDAAHEKYSCWCETNTKAKTAAVEAAGARIGELEAFIEQAIGLEGQLKTEIAQLEDAIAEDNDSLATATKLKEKETEEFQAEAKESKECIVALEQAVAVLEKVQLLQKSSHRPSSAQIKPLLMQLKGVVHGVRGRLGTYRGALQRDLWDIMSSFDAIDNNDGFLATHLSALESRLSVHQPTGYAAGAQSYNSRSGQILGVLKQLKDEFVADLSAAQKTEFDALVNFQKLRTAKLGEIAAATAQRTEKETILVDTLSKAANAKSDLQATKDALSADQKFILSLATNCKDYKEGYASRSTSRAEEIRALAEAITVLSEDDARDVFGRTFSFLQTGNVRNVGAHQHTRAATATDAARNKAQSQAMAHIFHAARKNKDWMLASLAVRVRLDDFTKVKEVMDKMLAQLKKEQKDEFEKKEFCNKEIDTTEDSVKAKSREKEDLEGTKMNLENTIAGLDADIEALKTEVEVMKIAMKRAGEDRKIGNHNFQQSVADQRATVQVLKKAQERLKMFYAAKEPALVQAGIHAKGRQPGQPVSVAPPTALEYKRNSGAGGVIQLLSMIIEDAKRMDAKLVAGEQNAQASYAAFVSDATATIDANVKTVTEKTTLVTKALADTSETEQSLLVNGDELENLAKMLSSKHLECDYILKYFTVRQKARSEEMDAIIDAKSILSGANFGNPMEDADDSLSP